MARPSTKKKPLKDGFYIEIKEANQYNQTILIHRETKQEIKAAIAMYSNTKAVTYYGEVKDGKLIAA